MKIENIQIKLKIWINTLINKTDYDKKKYVRICGKFVFMQNVT